MVMKHYPAEFKRDAVGLYWSRPGATIKSVAADLGVNTETLRNWMRAADGRRTGSHAASMADGEPTSPLESELAAARRKIRELEEERDILRRAAKYFAGETRW
ncbi:putative transposase [Streptomyces sp. NBRC 110611]|nr:putative transposase [Streptomyces sp. NBRC 110611]